MFARFLFLIHWSFILRNQQVINVNFFLLKLNTKKYINDKKWWVYVFDEKKKRFSMWNENLSWPIDQKAAKILIEWKNMEWKKSTHYLWKLISSS